MGCIQADEITLYSDPENMWFGFTMRARILAYAKDRIKPSDLSTYEALTDESWKTSNLRYGVWCVIAVQRL